MLTKKQHELLMFIHGKVSSTGVSPSFEEMKNALDLRSKSGIHRLITALEERGFLRRLPHRARAVEILKLPESMEPTLAASAAAPPPRGARPAAVIQGHFNRRGKGTPPSTKSGAMPASFGGNIPVLGRIAAGTPIEAIQEEVNRIDAPEDFLRSGDHYALEVQGDSMIDAGIYDGDIVLIQRCDDASTGEIVVALIDGEEATLKRLRKKGASIALEAENPAYETRIYGSDRVAVQGRLVGLMRKY